jgi:hypothetical protein
MFRQIRHTLVLTVAGLCAAGLTASASFAQAVYDPYLDALRNKPRSAAERLPAATSPAGSALIGISGQVTYDPYLDALRHRPRSIERRLAIGSGSTAKTSVAAPCGRCR